MFNPIDTRQINALVDHRRELVAADREHIRHADADDAYRRFGVAAPTRVAIGLRLMQLGARIAGTNLETRPHLRAGL
jgi:hypothetical protein